MTREQYLLTCLAEECSEVALECAKGIRFGLTDEFSGPKVRDRLAEELAQLQGVLTMMADMIDLTVVNDPDRHYIKTVKVLKFMAYSRERGCLQDLTDAPKEGKTGADGS